MIDGGVNSSRIYLIYSKNFCKYHCVPTPSTPIMIKKNEPIHWLTPVAIGKQGDAQQLSLLF
jgi:hypothetical protein